VFELLIQLIHVLALLSQLLIFESQFFIFVEDHLAVGVQGVALLIGFLLQFFHSFIGGINSFQNPQ
jgi:hypothetical protein